MTFNISLTSGFLCVCVIRTTYHGAIKTKSICYGVKLLDPDPISISTIPIRDRTSLTFSDPVFSH